MQNFINNGFNIPSQNEIDEAQANTIFEQTGFNLKLFNETVELQNKLNEKVDEAWQQKNLDWQMALLLESYELLDSLNWKWWKDGKTDWENIEIESIDIFHFLLAKLIETKQTSALSSLLMSAQIASNKKIKTVAYEKEIQDIMIKQLLPNLLANNFIGVAINWIEIWTKLGKDSNDLFLIYKMKYTLNMFRQDNGYKTGKYFKIWNGVEDNVVAQQLIIENNLKNDKNFIDDLTKLLNQEYDKIIKPEGKNVELFLENDEKWKTFMEMVPDENRQVLLDFANDLQKYFEN